MNGMSVECVSNWRGNLKGVVAEWRFGRYKHSSCMKIKVERECGYLEYGLFNTVMSWTYLIGWYINGHAGRLMNERNMHKQ